MYLFWKLFSILQSEHGHTMIIWEIASDSSISTIRRIRARCYNRFVFLSVLYRSNRRPVASKGCPKWTTGLADILTINWPLYLAMPDSSFWFSILLLHYWQDDWIKRNESLNFQSFSLTWSAGVFFGRSSCISSTRSSSSASKQL